MSQVDCSQFADIYEAALLVIANADKLRAWVNGDEESDVELGGTMVPTIRKLVAIIDARESAAAKEVIAKGIKDVNALKAETAELVDEAKDAAQRAEEAAQGVKSIIGTGKCPNVTRLVQAQNQSSGMAVATPPYYPFAGGIHVFYDGVLLSSGTHYQEQVPTTEDGKVSAITPLFNVLAGAQWEFHTWDHVGDPEQPEDVEEGA